MLEPLAEARDKGDFASVNKLEKDLAFNLGGHINHSVFWQNLSPNGGGAPEGELAAALDDAFVSFDKLKAHFTATALGVQGSGWAVLAWDSLASSAPAPPPWGSSRRKPRDARLGGRHEGCAA